MIPALFVTTIVLQIADDAGAAARPIGVTMITGHEVWGRVLDADGNVIVLDIDGFPTAITYDQLEPQSAYRTRINLIEQRRGGLDRLTAEDRMALGVFCLRRNQRGLAQRHFSRAVKLDRTRRAQVDTIMNAARDVRSQRAGIESPAPDESDWQTAESSMAGSAAAARAAIAGYKKIGDQVREVVGSDIRLLETTHFLIWTDWAKAEHGLLKDWCEKMYTVVAAQFGLPAGANVFAGKCPVFCLRSKKRFREVAKLLDEWDADNALGYTISEGNGHVHVVVCRLGGSEAGRDIFAATLVHELVHAFMHRYRSPRPLPSWLSEGLANTVAESVLDDRCFNKEAADATGMALQRIGRSLGNDFWNANTFDAKYYPAAHGLVAFLIDQNDRTFRHMIDDIKNGDTAPTALKRRFGYSYESLEAAWLATYR